MTVTLLNPGCDGVCNDCECPPPTATCSQSTDGGVRTVNWSVSGAVEAWIIKRCFGGYGYDSTETEIPITLTDGAASGEFSPADTACVYIVHAVNACDEEVTSQCSIPCVEIDCDEVENEPCNCIQWPTGRIRQFSFPLIINLEGTALGRTVDIPGGSGPVTFPDVDLSGSYAFTVFRGPLPGFDTGCNLQYSPTILTLYSEFWYNDSFTGQDVYAELWLSAGLVAAGRRFSGGSRSESDYLQLVYGDAYPCGYSFGSCVCPVSIGLTIFGRTTLDAANRPWNMDEINAYGSADLS